MRATSRRLALALLLAGGLAACGHEADAPRDPGAARPPPATKEAMVGLLRDVLRALEANDAERAVTYLVPFPRMTPEDARKAIGTFLERKEISGHGIDVLEAKGRFGRLLEVFPEKGPHWAETVGVDPSQCYALGHGDAQVAAYWGGDRPRLIRLNDVGKLE
jgi:hypothetical protein